jgi:hypothetical protein
LNQQIARNTFAAGNKNKVFKVLVSKLKQLEARLEVKIYDPDDVYDLLKRSCIDKLVKQASAIRQQMRTNEEVLIEGQIPASLVKQAK